MHGICLLDSTNPSTTLKASRIWSPTLNNGTTSKPILGHDIVTKRVNMDKPQNSTPVYNGKNKEHDGPNVTLIVLIIVAVILLLCSIGLAVYISKNGHQTEERDDDGNLFQLIEV